MKIQFNTDKTVDWDQRHDDHFTTLFNDELDRFISHITRVEVHISDENGPKDGVNAIRCLIEVRLEGRQPIAVTNHADTLPLAIEGSLAKMKASLKKILDRVH